MAKMAMAAEVVEVLEVMEVPKLDQPRPAAKISLRPRSVSIRPRSVGPHSIGIAGRIGRCSRRRIRIFRSSGFGTGREARHQDHQHEESKFTHALEMVSPARQGKIQGKSAACKNV